MKTHDANICEEYQNQFDLSELGLRHLVQDERQNLERHFEDCDHCRKWLSDWELIKLSTRDLSQLEVPSTVMAGIMSKLAVPPERVLVPAVSEVVIGGAGFGVLLLASAYYSAENPDGLAAWCVSFCLLICAHYFFSFTSRRVQVAS